MKKTKVTQGGATKNRKVWKKFKEDEEEEVDESNPLSLNPL